MRKTRILLSLVAVAFAAMALTASPAGAALEITKESTGQHCPAVSITGTNVTGGCLLHGVSEAAVPLKKHVFGVETAIGSCSMEFHTRNDEDGTGYAFEHFYSGAGCNRQPCKDGAGEVIPWPANSTEGPAIEGNEFLTTTFCVEPVGGGADESCEIDLPFNQTANHQGELGHATEISAHGVSGFRCELFSSHWVGEDGGTENGQAEEVVEVNHV